MKEQLEAIRQSAKQRIEAVRDSAALEQIRVSVLGKKGELTAILKQMGGLSAEDRPVMGQLANQIRTFLETELAGKAKELKALETAARLKAETLDVTRCV